MQTISDRMIQRMNELGITQAKIHRETGAGKATISSWINGTTEPSSKYMSSLASLFKCSTDWLITGRGEVKNIQNQVNNNGGYIGGNVHQSIVSSSDNQTLNNDVVMIDFYPTSDFHSPKETIYLTSQVLLINPSQAIATIMSDDFMQPVIREKSLVVAERSKGVVYSGKIYLLNMNGLLICRYLQQLSGSKIKVYSEKDPNGDVFSRDDFDKDYQIVGKVISWISYDY